MNGKVEMVPPFFYLPQRPCGHPLGFSIVEALVSAAILGVVVIAIVAMVRKSGDLQIESGYRQKARVALNERFETLYKQLNYPLIAEGTNDSSVTFGVGAGTDSLIGTLHTTIESALLTVSTTPDIPVKKVTLALAWDDIDGSRDSISITKWIAE